jgi:hypothetical protein
VALYAFDLFNKQSFENQWWFVSELLVCGLALSAAGVPNRDDAWNADADSTEAASTEAASAEAASTEAASTEATSTEATSAEAFGAAPDQSSRTGISSE